MAYVLDWLEQRHDVAEVHPIAQTVRPIDQHARVAQRRKASAVFAHRPEAQVPRARESWQTGTPPQSRAGMRPRGSRKTRSRRCRRRGTPSNCGSGCGSRRDARIRRGDGPDAFLRARQRSPLRRRRAAATARAYAANPRCTASAPTAARRIVEEQRHERSRTAASRAQSAGARDNPNAAAAAVAASSDAV